MNSFFPSHLSLCQKPPKNSSCADVQVGNGGFSLRNRKVMLAVIDRWGSTSGHLPFNEDVWFACGSHYLGSLANVTTANRFAIESVPFDSAKLAPFGVHKPWEYQTQDNLNRLIQVCPSLRHLMELHNISINISALGSLGEFSHPPKEQTCQDV